MSEGTIENFSFARYRPNPWTDEYKRVKHIESDYKTTVYLATFEYLEHAAWMEFPVSTEIINDKEGWPHFVESAKEACLEWAKSNWKGQ